jgi:hypothetical protein
MTVALFDGAALVWFIMFVTQARGTTQWAMALIGWVVGLVGAVIMVAGELILGQSLVVFSDPTRLGWVLITTVIVACVVHVTLVYLFHLADPTVKNRIEISQKISEKIERSYHDARKEIDRRQDALTAGLTESIYAEAEQELAGIMALSVRNKNRKEQSNREIMRDVIPGQARDVPPMALNMPPGSPAAARKIYTNTPGKKHQRPQPRLSGAPEPTFSGNGHGSAEHNAFSAAPMGGDAVKEAARHRPPSPGSNPKL